MTKQERLVDTMEEALSEHGIMPLHSIDKPLVEELCVVIRILYGLCQTKYGPLEIAKWVEQSAK